VGVEPGGRRRRRRRRRRRPVLLGGQGQRHGVGDSPKVVVVPDRPSGVRRIRGHRDVVDRDPAGRGDQREGGAEPAARRPDVVERPTRRPYRVQRPAAILEEVGGVGALARGEGVRRREPAARPGSQLRRPREAGVRAQQEDAGRPRDEAGVVTRPDDRGRIGRPGCLGVEVTAGVDAGEVGQVTHDLEHPAAREVAELTVVPVLPGGHVGTQVEVDLARLLGASQEIALEHGEPGPAGHAIDGRPVGGERHPGLGDELAADVDRGLPGRPAGRRDDVVGVDHPGRPGVAAAAVDHDDRAVRRGARRCAAGRNRRPGTRAAGCPDRRADRGGCGSS